MREGLLSVVGRRERHGTLLRLASPARFTPLESCDIPERFCDRWHATRSISSPLPIDGHKNTDPSPALVQFCTLGQFRTLVDDLTAPPSATG